ncbi:hypothetical protein OG709_16435 [Streptomyces sp. NBC_01267]|uniref:hypothetical protein n=1 Tax=Streptomyces sp. NBC_01267 TaxID=2903805 RepID=UPI002E30346C|nr:hypothetical protein [Streptomyces sp. NBC_01267]
MTEPLMSTDPAEPPTAPDSGTTAPSVPPMPTAPPVFATNPMYHVIPGAPVTPVKKDRRALRAVARWTLAAVVFGGCGAGAATGLTAMHRTDVPGLATASDGRWDFADLKLPALPAGTPRPFNDGNTAQIHATDARDLLLPAPAGATPDKKLTGGWVTVGQYASEYSGKDARALLTEQLRDYAVRHIAARGWTMPDGTSTRIYLLTFQSTAFAAAFKDQVIDSGTGRGSGAPVLNGVTDTEIDEGWSSAGSLRDIDDYVYVEQQPYGAQQVRQAYSIAGDTLALVVERGKGAAPAVPFHQTVILQDQLLS